MFSYLDNKKWNEITRDERFFCAEVYLLYKNNPKEFVSFLRNKLSSITDEDLNMEWELGYEVCFYRDFIKAFRKQIKMDNVFNSYSRKRTFDLCLFSEKKIIIIEAKVHESFNSEQMSFFEKEISYMQSMISLAGYTPPEIMLVYLASSNYFHNMKTFKKSLNPLLTDNYFTWKDLFDYTGEPLFAKANDLYRKTKMNSLIE